MQTERDYKIDVLRCIAIIGIVIAHTNAPSVVNVIRSFDVPLMVLLTGISFYLSNSNKEIKYIPYLWKRFKRLVVPTWIFLTVFFLVFYVISVIAQTNYQFSASTILNSYCLLYGIGYVWIIRVYFLTAMINPGVLWVSKKIKSNFLYFMMLFGVYVIYWGLIAINSKLSGFLKLGFENGVVYTVGWGLIAAIGIRIKQISKKEMPYYIGVFTVLTVALMVLNDFKPVYDFKYPPTLYYISFGMAVSLLLIALLDIKWVYNIFNNKIVKYISFNSLWLYFWHIVPIWILQLYGDVIPIMNSNFITRFVFIFGIGMTLTIIHERIATLWKKARKGDS